MSFMAGLSNDKNEICAIVEEDAEVIMLPSVAAAEWIRVDPEWYNFVFKIFHTRFTELLAIIDIVAFQKMDDRIMDILKKKTEIHRSNELNITHQQLAVELGTSREVTSRLLKQLEKQQYIKLSRGKVIMTECKYSSRGLEKI
jgi:CRP/FNR family transcriptional regulator